MIETRVSNHVSSRAIYYYIFHRTGIESLAFCSFNFLSRAPSNSRKRYYAFKIFVMIKWAFDFLTWFRIRLFVSKECVSFRLVAIRVFSIWCYCVLGKRLLQIELCISRDTMCRTFVSRDKKISCFVNFCTAFKLATFGRKKGGKERAFGDNMIKNFFCTTALNESWLSLAGSTKKIVHWPRPRKRIPQIASLTASAR